MTAMVRFSDMGVVLLRDGLRGYAGGLRGMGVCGSGGDAVCGGLAAQVGEVVQGPVVLEAAGGLAVALPDQPVLDDLVDAALVRADLLDQVVVVEEALAEAGTRIREPDPAGLPAEREVLDVQVAGERGGEVDRRARGLEGRDRVARVEDDPEVCGVLRRRRGRRGCGSGSARRSPGPASRRPPRRRGRPWPAAPARRRSPRVLTIERTSVTSSRPASSR